VDENDDTDGDGDAKNFIISKNFDLKKYFKHSFLICS